MLFLGLLARFRAVAVLCFALATGLSSGAGTSKSSRSNKSRERKTLMTVSSDAVWPFSKRDSVRTGIPDSNENSSWSIFLARRRALSRLPSSVIIVELLISGFILISEAI